MITCQSCHSQLRPGARFCSSCGSAQPMAQQPPQPAQPVAPIHVAPVQPAPAPVPYSMSPSLPQQPAAPGQLVLRNGRRFLLTIEPSAGAACQRCQNVGRPLRYGRYRRVIGALVVSFISEQAGYLCADCHRSVFISQTGVTLALGWLGVLALLVRSPIAIVKNVASVMGKPILSGDDEQFMLAA